ncbi:MAG: DUF3035 domain-containing protein [Albidovulum sp.]|nr:DUF3035 domain-containing protein [Albidovulum sp.]MDE0530338.1 DUF3035 domain-containing protein [Albidovulum sp.]
MRKLAIGEAARIGMVRKVMVLAAGCLAIIFAAGCSGSDDEPQLLNFKQSGSPDELSVMPANPLQVPASMERLPAPRSGGVNLAYPKPGLEAIGSLGGNPSLAVRDNAIPESDFALVRHAVRNGTIKGVRSVLAREDLEFRKSNDGRFFERLMNTNVYFTAYAPYSLDQVAEYERARLLGINVPAASAQVAATR